MTIVADPVAVPKLVRFTVTILSDPLVTKYEVGFYKNSTPIITSSALYRDIPVVNGDVVAIRVTPINDGGKGPTVEEVITVDWLPALPAAPEFTVAVS